MEGTGVTALAATKKILKLLVRMHNVTSLVLEFFGFARAHIQQERKAALNQDPQEPAQDILWKDGPVSQGNLLGSGRKRPNFMEELA